MSVLALCYNHEAYITAALDSVRAQTLGDYELVITDDASTDRSADLIQAWLDEHGVRATFIRQPVNRGICATLNDALARCTGEYVAAIPGDDLWLPRKLEVQTQELDAAGPRVGVVYSDAHLMGAAGEPLPGSFLNLYAPGEEPPTGDVFVRLLHGNFIPGMASMFRRDVLARVGLFDPTLVFEDWEFWVRVARRYEFCFSPYVSARYRILPTSLVRTMGDRADDAYWKLYLRHWRHSGAAREYVGREVARLHDVLAERHPHRVGRLSRERLLGAPLPLLPREVAKVARIRLGRAARSRPSA